MSVAKCHVCWRARTLSAVAPTGTWTFVPRPHSPSAGQSEAAKQIETERRGKLWLSDCCTHTCTLARTRSRATVQIYCNLPLDGKGRAGPSPGTEEGSVDLSGSLHAHIHSFCRTLVSHNYVPFTSERILK